MCGGTKSWLVRSLCTSGLSPRVRGNPNLAAYRGGFFGSIPACAGEPGSKAMGKPFRGVYPRVCGGTR